MSKQIKQLEMDSLKGIFREVRDLVVLSASGLDATTDNALRLKLRKKNIRLQVVKNSLCARAFQDLGMKIDGIWTGPTTLAWGAGSLAELSRTIDQELQEIIKKQPKLKETVSVKGAVAEGQRITFEQARTMPTREEAIGTIVAMVLGPASQIAGQLIGPAAQIAGQIQTLTEKAPEAASAA